MDGNGSRKPDYLKVKTTKTADGYICETSLASENVKKLKFKAGEPMGFHSCFYDADDGPNRKIQMTRTGREAHDQSQDFGQIIFSDKPMAINPKEKMSTYWALIKKN